MYIKDLNLEKGVRAATLPDGQAAIEGELQLQISYFLSVF